MTLNDSIQTFPLRVLTDAPRSANVTASCRPYGISRSPFYRWPQRVERYGAEGVHPKGRLARPGRPPHVSVVAERRVVAEALASPTCGPRWVRARLAREGLEVTPTTVWRVLHPSGAPRGAEAAESPSGPRRGG
jgi:hypothetical protein